MNGILTQYFMLVSYLIAISYPRNIFIPTVIATKIQKMHDQDPEVYPFQDWGSPTGKDYRAVLFLLPGVAGLSGGTLRIPNSFLTQVSGGRNVVFNTSLLLCVPMIMAGIVLSNPKAPFNALLAAALLSGVGGGAFASSMSNISFYYPKRLQGMALGYNGGIGNLGVSITQLLAPIFMSIGSTPVSPAGVNGWPANAGWLWFPICFCSAVLAFFYMSNQPIHGEKSNIISILYFYWMECVGFVASFIGVITLISTRNSALVQTAGGQVVHKFLLVILAAFCEHMFMMISPKKVRDRVKVQVVIFKRKHTYIMTWLYIMCFGSFIGYSGSFPKLIVDLFGYKTGDGCMVDGTFTPGVDEASCGGTYTPGASLTARIDDEPSQWVMEVSGGSFDSGSCSGSGSGSGSGTGSCSGPWLVPSPCFDSPTPGSSLGSESASKPPSKSPVVISTPFFRAGLEGV